MRVHSEYSLDRTRRTLTSARLSVRKYGPIVTFEYGVDDGTSDEIVDIELFGFGTEGIIEREVLIGTIGHRLRCTNIDGTRCFIDLEKAEFKDISFPSRMSKCFVDIIA